MRRLIRGALVVGVALAALLAGVVWFIEPLARLGLRAAGLEDVRFERLQLGLDQLEIEGLELGAGGESRLARLRVGFAPSELVRGQVEQIELEGLALHGRIEDGRLQLAGLPTGAREDAGTAAWLPVPMPRQIILRAAQIELDTPAGRLVLPLSGELRPLADRAAWSLAVDGGRLTADPGTLARADLMLEGEVPLDRPITLDNVNGRGRLGLRAAGIDLPGIARGLVAHGEVALALDHGRLAAETYDLWLKLEALGDALRPIADALPAPWRLELATGKTPLRLVALLSEDDLGIQLDGAARLVTAQPQAAATFALDLTMGRDGALQAVRPSRATLELGALDWRDIRLAGGRVELTAEGESDHLMAAIDLHATGSGAPVPGLAVDEASLGQRLNAVLADGTLTLSAPEPGVLEAARLAWQGDVRTGRVTLRLAPSDTPVFQARVAGGELGDWQAATIARLEPLEVTARAGGAPLELAVEAGQMAVRLAGAGAGLAQGRAVLSEGRLRLPDAALLLEGITTEVSVDPAGLVPNQAIPVGIGAIRHQGTPAWFTPLSLSGTVRPTDTQLRFDARLRRIDGGLELRVAGEHSLTSGRGRATVDLAPMTFRPDGLQPAALVPALGDLLTGVAGTLALDGNVRWQPGSAPGVDLALLIDEVSFALGPARLEQLNGVVRFDQLWPPSTLPGQQLAVALLDVGLPLTRGYGTFELQPDGTLAVEQLRWRFAGGVVRADPFRIGSDRSDFTLTLRAEGLDLAQIFTLTRLDGLTGEGAINGVLPIRVSNGEAVVTGGELVATRPGRLRYQPAQPPAALAAGGDSMGLLLEAARDFRYEALRITLDGRTDAAMDIGLHLKGANPDLYDGYPIEFNFALEGELANVLRQGLSGYQIPDQIRERVQGSPR